MELITVCSAEKIMPDTPPVLREERGVMLQNERYNFQVACFSDARADAGNCRLKVVSDIADCITVRRIGYVPVLLPCYPNADDDYISKQAGVFPDILFASSEGYLSAGKWLGFWITVEGSEALVGTHEITFELVRDGGEKLASAPYTLEVRAETLSSAYFDYTNWIHYDCICEKHGVEPFSDRFYAVTEKYVQNAVAHGMTVLFTPLFTPPLDTAVGGERPTVQLVKVSVQKGVYAFDFSELDKFVDTGLKCGIKRFEFSHLCTQWGAKHCPKIMATCEGEYKKLFGWETDSTGEAYFAFLSSFLPALTAYTERKGIKDICLLHISDEPQREDLAVYKKVAAHVKKYIGGMKLIDAVLCAEQADEGDAFVPVPLTHHAEAFLGTKAEVWTYYCCDDRGKYHPNRLMAMPNERIRALGVLLYYYGLSGFLHWGYNFYRTQYSLRTVDPYRETDAGGAFPSGDAFIVYPGEDGPLDSLRHEVFYEGVQDYKALKALEAKLGRRGVLTLLEREGVHGFDAYPHTRGWLAALRQKVNDLLQK